MNWKNALNISMERSQNTERFEERGVYTLQVAQGQEYEAVYERAIMNGSLHHHFVHDGFGDPSLMIRSSIKSGDFTIDGRKIIMKTGCTPNMNLHHKLQHRVTFNHLSKVYAEAKR